MASYHSYNAPGPFLFWHERLVKIAVLLRMGSGEPASLPTDVKDVVAMCVGPNLAKTKILAKYSTVNQVDRLHGGTKPAHAVREKEARERFAVT